MAKPTKTYAIVTRAQAPVTQVHRQEMPELGVTTPNNRIAELQRFAGNRALQRMGLKPVVTVVHKSTERKVQRATGLAETVNISNFAQEAVTYCRNTANANKPLTDLADHLMVKINNALKTIPSHECAHTFVTSGTTGAFVSSSFSININTAAFSDRSGVTKVSDLNQAEVAEIVDTVFHESRHSEQYFRLARALAGEGKNATQIATQANIPNTVAVEAVKSPLANNTANATLLGEVNEWRDFIGKGQYVAYKGKVGRLRDAIAAAREKVTARNFSEFSTAFDIVKGLMTSFFEPLIISIGSKDPKTSADTLVLNDVNAIKSRYDSVDTIIAGDSPTWGGLSNAMTALHQARYQAYRNYPHEVDAWARGSEAGAKYKELDNTPVTPPTTTTDTTTPPTTDTTTPPTTDTTTSLTTDTTTPPPTTWLRSGPSGGQRSGFQMPSKTKTTATATVGTGTEAPTTTVTTTTPKAKKKSWKEKLFEKFSKKRKKK